MRKCAKSFNTAMIITERKDLWPTFIRKSTHERRKEEKRADLLKKQRRDKNRKKQEETLTF